MSPVTRTKPKLKVVSGHLAHRKEWPTWKVRAYQWAPYVVVSVFVLTVAVVWRGVTDMMTRSSVTTMLCREGPLPEPVIHCEASDLDCLTNPTVVEVSRIKDAIRTHNVRMAKACISVM